jgi:hypothetical protein
LRRSPSPRPPSLRYRTVERDKLRPSSWNSHEGRVRNGHWRSGRGRLNVVSVPKETTKADTYSLTCAGVRHDSDRRRGGLESVPHGLGGRPSRACVLLPGMRGEGVRRPLVHVPPDVRAHKLPALPTYCVADGIQYERLRLENDVVHHVVWAAHKLAVLVLRADQAVLVVILLCTLHHDRSR